MGVAAKAAAPLRVSLRSWLRHCFAALQAANALSAYNAENIFMKKIKFFYCLSGCQ